MIVLPFGLPNPWPRKFIQSSPFSQVLNVNLKPVTALFIHGHFPLNATVIESGEKISKILQGKQVKFPIMLKEISFSLI